MFNYGRATEQLPPEGWNKPFVAETHEEQQLQKELLSTVGIRKFATWELRLARYQLRAIINARIGDILGPSLKAERKPVQPYPETEITAEDLQLVPDGTKVFSVCWGGTNQITAIITKENGAITADKINETPVEDNDKTMSVTGFSERIGMHIIDGIRSHSTEKVSGIKAVAVSLGIPQLNTRSMYGIDAQPAGKPSNWNFTDFDETKPSDEQVALTEPLLSYLNEHGREYGLQIDSVYFLPDNLGVLNDVNSEMITGASVSVLAGTGTNIALHGRDLQLSSTQNIFPESPELLAKMAELYPMFINNCNLTKYFTGGHRIKLRVAAAMHLLAEIGQMDEYAAMKIEASLLDSQNGSLLSEIASEDITQEGYAFMCESSINKKDFEIFQTACRIALEQAGQVLGVMTVAAVRAADYQEPDELLVPIAGSVMTKAHGVKVMAQETIDMFLPDNNIALVNASDLTGAGKFAMVKRNKK